MREGLVELLAAHQPEKRSLIPLLQKSQALWGYLPEDVMLEIASFTGVPEAQAYAVATFYAQFRLAPAGRQQVMVCRGTACHVGGGPRILEEVQRELGIAEGETTPDMEYTLETVACIGACGLAPCMTINQDVYGRLSPRKVSELFAARKRESEDG